MTDRLLATTIAAVMVCMASASADGAATVEHLNSGKIFPADLPFS